MDRTVEVQRCGSDAERGRDVAADAGYGEARMTIESTPLTQEELTRLDELALEQIAAHTFPGACPECNLEPGLVVRLVAEIRRARKLPSESSAFYYELGRRDERLAASWDDKPIGRPIHDE
jgi:hypothetical protein